MKPSVELSVVTSLYYSGPDVAEFHRRAGDTVQTLTSSYEIIFVNDGSPDDAFAQALALQKQDPHVVLVDLSRNFGHHSALMTGLAYARGKPSSSSIAISKKIPNGFICFMRCNRRRAATWCTASKTKERVGFLNALPAGFLQTPQSSFQHTHPA